MVWIGVFWVVVYLIVCICIYISKDYGGTDYGEALLVTLLAAIVGTFAFAAICDARNPTDWEKHPTVKPVEVTIGDLKGDVFIADGSYKYYTFENGEYETHRGDLDNVEFIHEDGVKTSIDVLEAKENSNRAFSAPWDSVQTGEADLVTITIDKDRLVLNDVEFKLPEED